MLPPSLMLTTKNLAHRLISRAMSAGLILFCALCFTACQPSGPRSLLLGDKYVRQGEYAKALKYLTRAAQLMPERPQVWNLLGVALQNLQQPTQATEAYQRALRIDRSFAPAHYNLAVLFLEQQRLQESVAELNT